jgi:RNA-directed DNA polymerase
VALINEMNPVIRGWSNYFHIGVAKEVFTDLDNVMYRRAGLDHGIGHTR